MSRFDNCWCNYKGKCLYCNRHPLIIVGVAVIQNIRQTAFRNLVSGHFYRPLNPCDLYNEDAMIGVEINVDNS